MPSVVNLIHWISLFVLIAALIVAALSDMMSHLIPNRCSAAIAAAFLVYAIGKPFPFWLHAFGASALLFVVGLALFARGAFGGGDVKLMTASGLWAGFDQMVLLLLVTAVAGGVLALAQLSPIGRLLPVPQGATVGTDIRARMRQHMPYGVAIAVAGICVGLARLFTS
jgi:prepilin peptidase CpaA